MGIVIRLLINALGVAIAAYVMKPHVTLDSFFTALVVAVILSFVNTFIKPILNILALPLNLLTLGLFSFIISGLMVLLVDALVPGFKVEGFLWAILFSLLLSIISAVLNKFT